MNVDKALNPNMLVEVCNILESRSQFYLMLAGFYFKPLTQEQIDRMAEEYTSYVVGDKLIDEGFDDIRRVLRKRHTGTRSILATEWTATFGGAEAYEGRFCVPNASVFLDASGTTYGKPRNELNRIYAEQCLRLAAYSGMPESHLSFELEFLSIISDEIIQHLQADELEQAAQKINLSKQFIQEHILTWFPQFRDLAFAMLKTRFYKGVIKITEGYLTLDLQTLDALEAEVQGI